MVARDKETGRLELERGREDGRSGGTAVGGYVLPGGATRKVQGDMQGPWVRNPPFPSDLTDLDEFNPVPDQNAAYAFTNFIDVDRYRTLALWLQWSTAVAGGLWSLSLVPQSRPRGPATNIEWSTVAVNPTIALVALPAPPFNGFGTVFGSRNIQPAEFRTPPIAGPFAMTMVVPFDVTHLDRIRFAFLQIGTDGVSSLQTGYTLAT